jgi:hypothetical protein
MKDQYMTPLEIPWKNISLKFIIACTFIFLNTASFAAMLENSCKQLYYPTAGVISAKQGTVQLTMTPHCDLESMRNAWPFAFGVRSKEYHQGATTVLGVYRTPGLDQWDGISAITRTSGSKRLGLTDMKSPVKAGQKINVALTWGPAGLFFYIDGKQIGRSAFEKELMPMAPFWEIGRMAPFYVSRIAISASQLSRDALNFNSSKDFTADNECTLLANKLSEPQFFAAQSFGNLISLAPFDTVANRIFYDDEEIKLAFVANNFSSNDADLNFKLNITSATDKKELISRKLRLKAGTIQKSVILDLPPYKPGLYTIEASSSETELHTFRISVLPRIAGSEGKLVEYLGAANNREPELFKRINLRWVRFWGAPELNWFQLEPMKGRWDFTTADQVVNAFIESNVNILAVMGYPPLWTAEPPPTGEEYKKFKFRYNRPGRWKPGNINEWTNYIEKTANHFKGRISHYEIYNEVDFKPPGIAASFSGTTEEYYDLLVSASKIIHNAAPENKVLISGFSMIPGVCDTNMPEKLLDMGAADHIDIWNLHSYRALVNIPEMKKMIRKRKPEMPLWQTEQMWHILKDKKKIRYLTVAINFWFLEHGFDKYMTFGWHEFLTDGHRMSPEDALHVFAVNQQFFATCDTYEGTLPELSRADFDLRHLLRRNDGKYLCAIGSSSGDYEITLKNTDAEIYDLLGDRVKIHQNTVRTNHSMIYMISSEKPQIDGIRRLDAGQLLSNTGFEELGGDSMGGIEYCTPSEWLTRVKYDPQGTIRINTKTPLRGNYAVNMTTSGKGRVYLFSYIKILSPGTYRISASFRNVSGKASPYICAFDTTSGAKYLKKKNFQTPPESHYVRYSFDITIDQVPGENLAVIFGVDGSAGTISCDEVEMKKITPPAFPASESVTLKLNGSSCKSEINNGKGAKIDLSPLEALAGKKEYAGVPFLIDTKMLIVSDKNWDAPRKARVQVPSGTYSEIHAVTCAMYTPKERGENLAELTLLFSDGEKAVIPVRNMIDTQDWYCDPYGKTEMLPVEKVSLKDHSERNLFYMKSNNPFPEKTLKEIELKSSGKGIMVFAGITLRKKVNQ